jgi:hypothetical protein
MRAARNEWIEMPCRIGQRAAAQGRAAASLALDEQCKTMGFGCVDRTGC